MEESCARFDWPATRAVFATSAARVAVRMDAGRNHFNVLVGGRLAAVLRGERGVRDYWLDACPAGAASVVVELQKRTEARIGTLLQSLVGGTTRPVTLLGILLEDGDLVGLPAAPVRRIEFVGDSETSGFGNCGPSEPGTPGWRSLMTMDPADQDAFKSWPALVAGDLEADFSIVAWSGMGVLWNAPGGGCSTSCTMREAYGRILASEANAGEEVGSPALDDWIPDVVVLYVGGNDWYSFSRERERELVQACSGLLLHIRLLRPGATVLVLCASGDSFCACMGSLEEQQRFASDMERCWRSAAFEARDPKVHVEVVRPSPAINVADESDWGQMAHWSARGHAKWARAVLPLVCKHATWPGPVPPSGL